MLRDLVEQTFAPWQVDLRKRKEYSRSRGWSNK
jgi:hypothetical protein